jgi:hypothetical protein
MRYLITTVALVTCVAVPLSASAEGLNPTTTQSPANLPNLSKLSELFHKLGPGLISTAQAQQQCRDESETCTSDAQCCPDLSVSAAPQVPAERRTDLGKPLPLRQHSG